MIGRLALIAAGVVAFATACGGPVAHVSGPSVQPTLVAAGSFVATVGDSVDVLRRTDGSVERVLMSTKRGDLMVNGLALRGQELFVTYSAGPRCSSGVAGCGPQPGTCGAEVDRVDLSTDARSVVWKVGRDTLLAGGEPSPDGTRIAALTSPCVPSYFNQHLVVRDLANGATVTIGGALPRCHVLGSPAWTGDGKHLVVAYAPATGAAPYSGSDGTCTSTATTSLLKVDARTGQPGIDGVRRAAPSGCTYWSVAARAGDVYAVVGCGPLGIHGPASVQRLTDDLVPQRTWPIGNCTDGSSIAINKTGSVLVAAYLFCNPPLAHQAPTDPVTVLDRIDADGLQRVSAAPGGTTTPDDLTW